MFPSDHYVGSCRLSSQQESETIRKENENGIKMESRFNEAVGMYVPLH